MVRTNRSPCLFQMHVHILVDQCSFAKKDLLQNKIFGWCQTSQRPASAKFDGNATKCHKNTRTKQMNRRYPCMLQTHHWTYTNTSNTYISEHNHGIQRSSTAVQSFVLHHWDLPFGKYVLQRSEALFSKRGTLSETNVDTVVPEGRC